MPPPPPLLPPVTMTSSSTLTRYAIGLDSSAALTTPKIKPKRSPLYTATCSATATSTPRRPPPTPPPPGPDSIARGFRRCFLSGVLTCFISWYFSRFSRLRWRRWSCKTRSRRFLEPRGGGRSEKSSDLGADWSSCRIRSASGMGLMGSGPRRDSAFGRRGLVLWVRFFRNWIWFAFLINCLDSEVQLICLVIYIILLLKLLLSIFLMTDGSWKSGRENKWLKNIFHNLYEIVKYVCGLVLHKK